jgi:hypothetical protein
MQFGISNGIGFEITGLYFYLLLLLLLLLLLTAIGFLPGGSVQYTSTKNTNTIKEEEEGEKQ